MSRTEDYRAASVRADQARSAFLGSITAAKARIAPARLKADTKRKIIETAMNGTANTAARIQERPIAVGAAAGAFLIFLTRKPLAALFRRLYVHIKSPGPENSETDDA